MNILIINGPNLNLLGQREPKIYGKETYEDLVKKVKTYGEKLNCQITVYQTNHEGNIIDLIQENYQQYDGIIINPGAFTHYSYAIRDCLAAVPTPTIEVHLSNINKREAFRKKSVIKDVVKKTIMGQGIKGYLLAIDELLNDKK